MHALLLANLAATLFMTGLIWFVQIVHYPLFAAVGSAGFPNYARSHQMWTTLVVGPPMLLEALTAVALIASRPPQVSGQLAWAGVVLVLVIWLSTAALQVPAHGKLSSGFDPSVGSWLVSTNWIRTVCWSARSAVVLAMVAQALGGARS